MAKCKTFLMILKAQKLFVFNKMAKRLVIIKASIHNNNYKIGPLQSF